MIYHLTWRKITSPLSGSPLRVRIHLACRDPPRVLGSTSRVGIHLACRGHPLGPAAPRGVPSTLGGSLHARWVPPRSGDPSTLRGSLHVISLRISVVPPHVAGDHFALVGIPLACQDPTRVSGSTLGACSPSGCPLQAQGIPPFDLSSHFGGKSFTSLAGLKYYHIVSWVTARCDLTIWRWTGCSFCKVG